MSDLINRLRGQYNLPITDGGGPINGSMEYKRSFVMPPICGEAADEIDRLTRELAAHEKDQRVIEAAEKMRYDFSEQNRAEYDKAMQS